jgi:fructosamine-3-kinase
MTKTYTKRLEGVSVEYPTEVYKKYNYFSELFKDVSGIEVPKPIALVGESIELKFVDLSGVVSGFYIPDRVETQTFETMGSRIAQMHSILELEGSGFIHGDMVPLNIVVNDDGSVTIFDLEPPKSCNNFYYYYKGDRHIDIATFIFWTMLEGFNTGGYARSLLYRSRLARAFSKGYSQELSISKFKLMVVLYRELQRFVCLIAHKK